jgi:ABC-2 type transport system ATP-binding protein
VLRLHDLHKRYGSLAAVDGVSLHVRRGEIFGFLGPNGAGKTTTIAMAVGLLEPDSGSVEITVLGSPRDPQVRRLIGLAPQSLALYDALSARENLAFFGKLYGLSGKRLEERVDAMLELVGLADRAKDNVSTFSGGMKRRLNLAVALVHEPKLLLLDEPTVGVDPQSRNAIFDLVRTLREQGITVVYTTHYMEEAQKLCDRVAIIDQGRVLAEGTVDELIEAHGGESLLSIQAGESVRTVTAADPLPEMAAALRDEATTGLKLEPPDLERVFLNLTGRTLRD